MILHKISQNACRSQMERSRNVMWSSGYYSPLIWWIWHSLTEYVFNKLINRTEIACGCHLNWYLIDSLKGFLPYHEVVLRDSVWTAYYFKPCESTLNFQFDRRTIFQGQSLLYWCPQQSNIFQQMWRLTFLTSGWVFDTAFIHKIKVEFHSRINRTEKYWLSFLCTVPVFKFGVKQVKMQFEFGIYCLEAVKNTFGWLRLKRLEKPHNDQSCKLPPATHSFSLIRMSVSE